LTQRRQLVELLIDRVMVTNGDVEIHYVIPTTPASEHVRFSHLRTNYLDRLPGTVRSRQRAPGAAGTQPVPQALDDARNLDRPRTATWLGGRDQRREHHPRFSVHVTGEHMGCHARDALRTAFETRVSVRVSAGGPCWLSPFLHTFNAAPNAPATGGHIERHTATAQKVRALKFIALSGLPNG
jgi:hypothetical protein